MVFVYQITNEARWRAPILPRFTTHLWPTVDSMFQSRFSRASLGEVWQRKYDNKVISGCPMKVCSFVHTSTIRHSLICYVIPFAKICYTVGDARYYHQTEFFNPSDERPTTAVLRHSFGQRASKIHTRSNLQRHTCLVL